MKRHSLWLPVLALTPTILMLAYAARKPEPSRVTLENVRAEARNGGYRLITTEELWGWFQSDSDDLLLVGHTPGMGISHRSHQGRRQLPDGTHLVVTLAEKECSCTFDRGGQEP